MKQLYEIFDKMDEGELKELMEGVDGETLDRETRERIAGRVLPGTRKPRKRWLPAVLAATLALVCLAGAGGYALVTEVRAYNEAVEFFEEYDLDTEGLTRAEIRAVYRDITTGSFTYDKTAEFLAANYTRNNATGSVGGYVISQETPTAEEMRLIWEQLTSASPAKPGVSYSIRYVEYPATMPYEPGDVDSIVERYEDGELVWSTTIKAFMVHEAAELSDGVLVWGNKIYGRAWNSMGWLAKLGLDGKILWMKPLSNGFADESIATVVVREDGKIAVVSRGQLNYICLTVFSADGKELSFAKTELDCGIQGAAKLGDGYLLALWKYQEGQKFAKMDADGQITGFFTYDGGDSTIVISEMMEYGGSVYLSGYSVPRLETHYGSHDEIGPVLRYFFDRGIYMIESEELTPMVRDNYTALLLICDADTGEVNSFYEAQGSLGGKLSRGDTGELLWDVESITAALFSPATNAFSVAGTCEVYRYAFDAQGTLLSQQRTGEITRFYK